MQIANAMPAQPALEPPSVRALIDPMNRKARRTFNSLFRRKKLKHLAVAGLFSAGFVQFCALNLPEHW